MRRTVMFSLRMDKEAKKKCEKIYGELGVTLSGAINVFLHKSAVVGGFPFDVRLDESARDELIAQTEEPGEAKKPRE